MSQRHPGTRSARHGTPPLRDPDPSAGVTPMRQRMIALLAALLRFYLRHTPSRFGHEFVWNRIVAPYITWRRLPVVAKADFGARFEGSLPDTIHKFLYFFGVWEPAVTRLYRAILREGDVVVDVGANVGAHALLASHLVGASGRVHAIEASPWIFERLQRNIAINGAVNIRAYNMAATQMTGPVTVFLHDDTNLGGTTILASEAAVRDARHEASVQGKPLPDIVTPDELRAARLLKIDVEGAEWLVVTGMLDLLPSLRPDIHILVEVNPAALADFGISLDVFIGHFTAAGFSAFEVPHSYLPRDYIRPGSSLPVAFDHRDGRQLDLLLVRENAVEMASLLGQDTPRPAPH
jgi:FkbM family methyltransferase